MCAAMSSDDVGAGGAAGAAGAQGAPVVNAFTEGGAAGVWAIRRPTWNALA